MTADIVNGHTTATLYEAAQSIEPGLVKVCDPGLRAVWHGARVAARAYTVRGRAGDNLALHDAVLQTPAGCVLVVDLQGAQRHVRRGQNISPPRERRRMSSTVTRSPIGICPGADAASPTA